ncbi:hypothetical protein A1O1_08425 [Capronia coronata CBS 617.96]|uniref:Mei2-like C-terminal RNA recognition motif domain-containing protein n=1 Tax=Capronia coronata CBS 617.96 TaxID=1182541 RepID=W9XJA1_9EURO|nr:uncharacterized protein A1O1_08425 [Capronia coronata CBS 617.96]EXJ80283.1 hypothetical protein A1O1_08425 [Capronia coronata CBS 617.96]
MSPPRGAGMASSPHSENETSSHGTPSTNPTTFTPEAASGTKGKARVTAILPRPAAKIGASKANNNAGDDVFLNAPTSRNRRQLSPTAQVFRPNARTPLNKSFEFPVRVVAAARTKTHFTNSPVRGKPVTPAPVVQAGGVSSLLRGSTPEREAKALTPEQAQPVVPGVIGGPRVGVEFKRIRKSICKIDVSDLGFNEFIGTSLSDVRFHHGTFSTDENVTRAWVVAGIPANFRSTDIAVAFKTSSFPSLRSINASQIISNGLFTVSFADVRDAKKAFDVINSILPLARVFPLSPKGLATDEGKDPHQVSDFEGQAIVTVYHNGHPGMPQTNVVPVIGEVKRLLSQCGDIKAFHSMAPTQRHLREFRVEFFNAGSVEIAKEVINGNMGTVLDFEPYKPDIRAVVSAHGSPRSPREQLSITGRSTVPIDPDYDRLATAIQREALRTGRRLSPSINHNAVDIARIQAGIDVRTTASIMLRNIPNRVDQSMLKRLLDVTSHGRYDFMYLRIDFANNCNVGYAFINFVDFVLARAGKRWNCFASDKVAEVSYATIQGRDCLVQKFRNSSVMLEHPGFRPKLFVAGNVPNAGQEERFPGPDNASKMRRSVENAEHVGLFIHTSPTRRFPCPVEHRVRRAGQIKLANGRRAGHYLPPARANASSPQKFIETAQEEVNQTRGSPRTVNVNSPYDPFAGGPARFSQGQAYREEQRRRRSQFDRGTPGAENEMGMVQRYRLHDPALDSIDASNGFLLPHY